jgi:hypothetical protein
MNEAAKIVLHLVPPSPYVGSWVEIDGKLLPCKSLLVEFEGINDHGTVIMKIGLHRVDLVLEPLPEQTETK